MITRGSGRVRAMCEGAVIAAAYVALTFVTPMSFGPIQFRVSEALTLLPAVSAASVPGLFIGCALANLLGSSTVWDIVFGSLATLAAAALTRALRRNVFVACLPPIVLNGLVVGAVLSLTSGGAIPLLETMATVALGEAAVVFALGVPLLSAIRKAMKKRGNADDITDVHDL